MAPVLTDCEAATARRLRDAAHLSCLLDYDGTLAPLAPTPGEAHPLPGTADLLHRLATAPATEVAIITGRTIADVRSLIDVPGVHYVGVHGLEIEWASGKRWLAPGASLMRAALPSIRERLEQALHRRPGIMIEDKGAALACHYRLAAPADAASAQHAVAAIVRTYRRRGVPVTVLRGHAVSEIRPATVNKGQAVRVLLAACVRQSLAIYVGDDETDADAFRALPADALTVQVGAANGSGPARYRLPGPPEVQRFLRWVLACRGAKAG